MQNLSLRMINRGKVTGKYRIVAGHALFFCFTGSCGLLGRHATKRKALCDDHAQCQKRAKNGLRGAFLFHVFFPSRLSDRSLRDYKVNQPSFQTPPLPNISQPFFKRKVAPQDKPRKFSEFFI